MALCNVWVLCGEIAVYFVQISAKEGFKVVREARGGLPIYGETLHN